MADVIFGFFGGLVLLAGVSVYSALKLAKRTDEIVDDMQRDDDERVQILVVRFPDAVFANKACSEVVTKQG